jgi:hypothetical protein
MGTKFNLYCAVGGGALNLVNGTPFTSTTYLLQAIPSGTPENCQATAIAPDGTVYGPGPIASLVQ